MNDNKSSTAPTIVGIDIGSLTTKVTLGSSCDYELVRNAHGGHTSPTAITFPQGKHRRLIGEDASEISRADGNTISMLDRLLVDSLKDSDAPNDKEDPLSLSSFRRYQVLNDHQKVHVPNTDKEYSATALVAMLLGNIKRNVNATIKRLNTNGDETSTDNLHFIFAVPPNYPESTCNALKDAAFAASVSSCSVVYSPQAIAAVYQRKFEDVDVEKEKMVLVVEMGHTRTSVSVLKKYPIKDDESDKASNVEVLSTISSSTLGASLVDIALYYHFISTISDLSDFKTDSRAAQRLLAGCSKLKHQLSMLSENTQLVENIGKNDSDVKLSCTRDVMKQLCQESVVDKLKGMIESAIEKAGGKDSVGDIEAVEISGGGARIPFVQEAIRDVLGKEDDFVFARSLDDTSLAFGAALVGSLSDSLRQETDNNMDDDRKALREELLKDELEMSQQDTQYMKADELRNKIEALILELRSAARHDKHGSLMPTSDDFTTFLDGTDDWLFSDDCANATLEEMETKWQSVESTMNEMCAEYLKAKKQENDEKERAMEEEAKVGAALREAEKAMNGEDEADHDTRKLPTKRRMDIVMKNKKEANELFSDKNYRHAAARYAKALTHCSKFFDLSPDEQKEVDDVKMSLYLNIALAYIKLEKLDNALQSCNDALKIDEKNTKALYRRATVLYQKRKFDDAVKDLIQAEKLAPDDKAILKLRKLVDQQLAKQKKKEKAFAKKMFA